MSLWESLVALGKKKKSNLTHQLSKDKNVFLLFYFNC